MFVQTKDRSTNLYQTQANTSLLFWRFVSSQSPSRFFKTRFLYLPNPKTLWRPTLPWKAADANSPNNRGQIYDESPEAAKKEAKTFVDKMCPKHTTPSINPTKMKECLPKRDHVFERKCQSFLDSNHECSADLLVFRGVIKAGIIKLP